MTEDLEERDQFINRNLSFGHLTPVLISAGVRCMQERDSYWFQISYDLGQRSGGSSCTMTTVLSKQYDNYDEAVLAMNDSISEGPEL